MSKNNNTQPKLSKKEKRELAEKQKQEFKQKRTKFYLTSSALALLAVLSYYFAPKLLPEVSHDLIHIIGYSLMGVAGFTMQCGAKYEDTEKRQKSSTLIANVLMVISFGVVVSGIVYGLLS